MAVAWIKRLFGITRTEEPRQVAEAKGAALAHKPSEISPPKSPAHTSSNTGLHQVLRNGFCELLFGADGLYDLPTDEQRALARNLFKELDRRPMPTLSLPRRPNSLPMLLKLLKMDDLSYKQISEVLLADPSLTTTVLRTSNSPLFRVSEKPIDSLEQAIFVLGVGGIKMVVSAAVMMPVFNANEEGSELNDILWKWALCVGKAFDALSRSRGESENSVYLTGLLPALAYLIVARELSELEASMSSKERLLPLQKLDLLERFSPRVAIEIRKEWGLPESIDSYLIGLREKQPLDQPNSLYDAAMLSKFAVTKATVGSPLGEDQLHSITASTRAENDKVLRCLGSLEQEVA